MYTRTTHVVHNVLWILTKYFFRHLFVTAKVIDRRNPAEELITFS